MRHGSHLDPPNRFESTRRAPDLEQLAWDDEPLRDVPGRAIEYLGALPDVDAHRDDRALADDHALDDFGARTDEAMILDDGRRRLQGFQDSADPDAALELLPKTDAGRPATAVEARLALWRSDLDTLRRLRPHVTEATGPSFEVLRALVLAGLGEPHPPLHIPGVTKRLRLAGGA